MGPFTSLLIGYRIWKCQQVSPMQYHFIYAWNWILSICLHWPFGAWNPFSFPIVLNVILFGAIHNSPTVKDHRHRTNIRRYKNLMTRFLAKTWLLFLPTRDLTICPSPGSRTFFEVGNKSSLFIHRRIMYIMISYASKIN